MTFRRSPHGQLVQILRVLGSEYFHQSITAASECSGTPHMPLLQCYALSDQAARQLCLSHCIHDPQEIPGSTSPILALAQQTKAAGQECARKACQTSTGWFGFRGRAAVTDLGEVDTISVPQETPGTFALAVLTPTSDNHSSDEKHAEVIMGNPVPSPRALPIASAGNTRALDTHDSASSDAKGVGGQAALVQQIGGPTRRGHARSPSFVGDLDLGGLQPPLEAEQDSISSGRVGDSSGGVAKQDSSSKRGWRNGQQQKQQQQPEVAMAGQASAKQLGWRRWTSFKKSPTQVTTPQIAVA